MSDKQVKVFGANSTDAFMALGVQGDTVERFSAGDDGLLEWGAGGSSALDVALSRSAADTLQLAVGDSLDIAGHNGTVGLKLGGTVVTASAAEINRIATGSAKIVNCAASTLTVTQALHANRIVTLNRAAGIAVTLPAATGTGDTYKFIVGTTFTGASSIAVPNATDYMIGTASMGIDGGTAVPHQYPTANTGTVATESDTINLLGTSNSTGGIKGQIIELIDIAAAVWYVRIVGDAGGTEATPFSAAV